MLVGNRKGTYMLIIITGYGLKIKGILHINEGQKEEWNNYVGTIEKV